MMPLREIEGIENPNYRLTYGICINIMKNQRLSRACIVHLVIKRTNWSYVKTMSCSGSHLGIPINIKNKPTGSRFSLILYTFNSIQFKVLFKVDTYSIHITQALMSF
jgi:hypothetical protein